jgi:hypothetical protein
VLDEFLIRQARRDNFARHRVRKRNIGAYVEPEPHLRPLRRACPPRVNRIELCPAPQALQQVVEENRMRLPSIRSPQQDDVRLFNFAIRACSAARAEYRRQTGDAWRVSSPVAAVDVVAADHRPHELLRDVIQLVRRFRATEHSEGSRSARITFPPEP